MSDTDTETGPATGSIIQPDQYLTSYEVGALIQFNPSSVNKWSKEGKLKCYKTPGGHRRFQACDVVAFLIGHHMPVPQSLQSVVAFAERTTCGE